MGMEIRGFSSRVGAFRNQQQITKNEQRKIVKASEDGNTVNSIKIFPVKNFDTIERLKEISATTTDVTDIESDEEVTATEKAEKSPEQLVQEFIEAFKNYDYTLDEAKAYLESIGAEISVSGNSSGVSRFAEKIKSGMIIFPENIEFTLDGKVYKAERRLSPKNESDKTVCRFMEAFKNGEYTLSEAKAYLKSIGADDIYTSTNLLGNTIKIHFTINGHEYGVETSRTGVDDRFTLAEKNTEETSNTEEKEDKSSGGFFSKVGNFFGKVGNAISNGIKKLGKWFKSLF